MVLNFSYNTRRVRALLELEYVQIGVNCLICLTCGLIVPMDLIAHVLSGIDLSTGEPHSQGNTFQSSRFINLELIS